MAQTIHENKAGRASSDENMNLLHSEPAKVAAAIKDRIMARGRMLEVYVSPEGYVRLDRPQEQSIRSFTLPTGWLVGTYSRMSSEADIADDLEVRLAEIREDRK